MILILMQQIHKGLAERYTLLDHDSDNCDDHDIDDFNDFVDDDYDDCDKTFKCTVLKFSTYSPHSTDMK